MAINKLYPKYVTIFSPEYWLERDSTGEFPQEFVTEVCEGGQE